MGNATLVIMAAGLGSRCGGNKQADRIVPMKYFAHDAIRAGIDKVVFVVRPEMEGELCNKLTALHADGTYPRRLFESLPKA